MFYQSEMFLVLKTLLTYENCISKVFIIQSVTVHQLKAQFYERLGIASLSNNTVIINTFDVTNNVNMQKKDKAAGSDGLTSEHFMFGTSKLFVLLIFFSMPV